MCRRVAIQLILLGVIYGLVSCAPATYRGWSDGQDYFKDPQQTSQQSSSKAASSSATKCGSPYRVRSGDTLGEIAIKCSVSLSALAEANQIVSPYTLFVNQRLKIPTASAQSSQRKPPISQATLPNPGFVWPASQTLKYVFVEDQNGLHGLSLFGDKGEKVYAMNAGDVVYAGNGIKQYGSMVIIKHDNDYLTVYAHNDTLQVVEGARVSKKQLIATIGSTGEVLKPQLYVEARYLGRKVDIKSLFRDFGLIHN